jgi:non-canonical poly(A) RNA polymerase PAPD5/7
MMFSAFRKFSNNFLYFRFHREVESFVDWISPSPVEDEIRGLIVTQITQIISAKFPDAHVFPFGSYQTKLYLPMG